MLWTRYELEIYSFIFVIDTPYVALRFPFSSIFSYPFSLLPFPSFFGLLMCLGAAYSVNIPLSLLASSTIIRITNCFQRYTERTKRSEEGRAGGEVEGGKRSKRRKGRERRGMKRKGEDKKVRVQYLYIFSNSIPLMINSFLFRH